jgi:hypothetical protein
MSSFIMRNQQDKPLALHAAAARAAAPASEPPLRSPYRLHPSKVQTQTPPTKKGPAFGGAFFVDLP